MKGQYTGFIFVIILLFSCSIKIKKKEIFLRQGCMAGEISHNSAILQSRLTAADTVVGGDLPGVNGFARFELSETRDFGKPFSTSWMEALPPHDFIIKTKVGGLESDTRYYYRLIYGEDTACTYEGNICTFRTVPGPDGERETRFVIVTGMNYHKFHHGPDNKPERVYKGSDKALGYPALKSILDKNPDFVVFTGDNVYYDKTPVAVELKDLRRKWHRQFFQPRFIDLFSKVPGYWEKDDHDHRFNDCDTMPGRAPSSRLGIETFREQVPVIDPADEKAVTYRTFRVSKYLQIWLTEGRDYRSPNAMPDGPDKSIWGKAQKKWLKETLLQSDATFKVLVSPTPMVGPDDAYKSDNHVNQKGFRKEGDSFFLWLKENDFLNRGFYLACGDRHWQYHSIHPSGFEEFSCGAIVDANSRPGRLPGDPASTDPGAVIRQPYVQGKGKNSGGFLFVTVKTSGNVPSITFDFHDTRGKLLYSVTREN